MVSSDEVQSSHTFNPQDGSSLHFNKFDKLHGLPNGASNTQADIFSNVQDIVLSTLEGLSRCVMVFGQTGSGKTYTLTGNLDNSIEEGLLSRYMHLSIMGHLRHGPSSPSLAAQQGEELHAIVTGALKVHTEEELVNLTQPGLARRIMACMKAGSTSRCHVLINLTLQRHLPGGAVMCGKLAILEVEGSEQEDIYVALAVPWLLQDVLEQRMALIVCCSPAASDAEETISSLIYGTCAKAILWVKEAPAGSAADIQNQQSAAAIQRIMQSFEASTKSIEEAAKMREETSRILARMEEESAMLDEKTARVEEESAKVVELASKLQEKRAMTPKEQPSSKEIASFQAQIAIAKQATEDLRHTLRLRSLDARPQAASRGLELQSRKRKASTLDGADAAARPQADARAARSWELIRDMTGFPALVIGVISLVVYIWMYQGE
ncbi:g10981 [Coccomyxa viridis]|uniref:G10981 protein n=1 Tax=Coccomyxa viridis TaxID=1274662 RepID=A0ABP1GBH1_9CHLO